MKPDFKFVYMAACEMFFNQAERYFHETNEEHSELDECDLIIAALAAHLIEAMSCNGTHELSIQSNSSGEEKELFLKLQHNKTEQVVH